MQWVILTGEYPPQPGGVSDYTRLLGNALVKAGDEVEVRAPPIYGPELSNPQATIHRLPDRFGIQSRRELSQALRALPIGGRVLVQYVPQAFGWKGMNLPFIFWLWRQRKRRRIDVMFHEVAPAWSFGWRRRNFRRYVFAAITRIMAFFLARSARRIFVSIPAWKELLKPLTARSTKIEWLPVPSNIPEVVDRERVTAQRQVLRGRSDYLLGHFSLFRPHAVEALLITLPKILNQNPDAAVVLVGREGSKLRNQLLSDWPAFCGRISASGYLEGQEAAEQLAACDLLIQPYPDGVSSRRGSAMAGLALGLPILTLLGLRTEPIWVQSRAVELAMSLEALAAAVGPLLANKTERLRLALTAKSFYREYFHIDRSVDCLRKEAESA